jgi:hypothetical protein
MVFDNLRREERIGLGIAVALHVALVAALLIRPGRPPVFEPPERMTVSLAPDVGLEATAPDPVPESREAIAPTISPEPAPPLPEPAIQPRPAPRAVATPPPRPQPRATTAPRQEQTRPRQAQRPSPPTPVKKPAGGSRIGADFLPGSGSSTTTSETRIPASQIGASAKASVVQQIIRQIKPHWSAPQGADADLLVTVLSFKLNPDGSLAGTPRVISQSGITDANRPQAKLHAERAIRAVQLAAPFDLPDEYYNAWKSIDGAKFDRNLSR